MRSRLPAALGAAIVLFVGTAARADAWTGHHRSRLLPPVAGTLRMQPGEFGHARAVRSSRRFAAPETVRVVRGGLYPRETDYQAFTPAERWATGGTGVSGLIGNTGNPYAGETEWGTADSATTGAGGAPRFGWQRRGLFTSGEPLLGSYDESPIGAVAGLAGAGLAGVGSAGAGLVNAGYDEASYGATPQLPFYGTGTPYSMSYYSSGSSAGPDGSPGGLGTYRSGSYGYGPRVIGTGDDGRYGGYRQGCTCGPRVVHLRRHRFYADER